MVHTSFTIVLASMRIVFRILQFYLLLSKRIHTDENGVIFLEIFRICLRFLVPHKPVVAYTYAH